MQKRPQLAGILSIPGYLIGQCAVFVALGVLPTSAGIAAEPETADVPPADGKTTPADAGLWPTPTLQKLLLRRFARDVASRFEFRDDQIPDVERAVMDRWSTYLDENEGDIKPLVNEYLELKMQLEPPPKADIQDWARRAGPVFSSLRSQLEGGVDDLRELADPEQRSKIDMQGMMLQGALNMTQMQIEQWEEGQFDPAAFIEPTAAERRKRAERIREQAKEKAAIAADAAAERQVAHTEDGTPPLDSASDASEPAKPKDFIAEEMTLWEKFVADFVKRFELDKAQRDSAWSVLQEMQARARSYRNSRRSAIRELEGKLAEPANTEEAQQLIENRIRDLYGPVDEMFGELQRRVERLPTPRQRMRARQRAAEQNSAEPTENTSSETKPIERGPQKEENRKPATDPPDSNRKDGEPSRQSDAKPNNKQKNNSSKESNGE